jgi:hypothetical protein
MELDEEGESPDQISDHHEENHNKKKKMTNLQTKTTTLSLLPRPRELKWNGSGK